MEERVQALERRLGRMEQEVRICRAVAVVAVALSAVGGLTADARPSPARPPAAQVELRTQRLVLVSRRGETRGSFEVTSDDVARLSLQGPDGVARLSLESSPDGSPSVALNDAAGRKRVTLDVTPQESRVSVLGLGRTAVTLANDTLAPRVAVADGQGRERVWLAVRLGSPVLQFLDARGAARTGLTTFNDETGVAVVSASDRTQPGLVLLGKDGTIVWSVP